MSAPLRPWDHVRALLIAVHVVAVVGMSLPAPPKMNERLLANGDVAKGLAVWTGALARVGVAPETTRALVLVGGGALARTEDRMEAIFSPYRRWAGVDQSWRMFSGSPARGSRVELWLEEDGAWRRIYAPLDPEARWRAGLWEDGRVRGALQALSQEKFERWWAALAKSAARRAARDFPHADTLRLQRVPLRYPTPEDLVVTGRVVEREPVGVVDVALAPLREPR